ncbi:NAD-dependent epimerase/dehydratase family protein [Bremerella cremea]|uniref:NAD-dependent epimerase/dehydratase family protein n=1 Tax=Bremerella cremea TaxID=1031537 RepID=A0A368KVG5_9BACT|nr:NAD(P)H-binding protein [Bremerella cremea]RCS52721.1 NAD-dependent epimerase/dehydratase family protein [Bremerella cremea]
MTCVIPNDSLPRKSILVAGASGYIGSRLVPKLLPFHNVRCFVRNPDRLDPSYRDQVEISIGDVLHSDTIRKSLEGIDVAYYLIHGMGNAKDFEKNDRLAAQSFVAAAKQANVSRIIYLGGLGDDNDPDLSPHLRSRHEVGEIFQQSGVPTIELRASVVLGPGSLSYEMIRSLTQKLPIMICPRWLSTPTQPIATEDILQYLFEAIALPLTQSDIFEVGSHDVVTYGQLIQMYAQEKNLTRILVRVPFLTPYLSSLWLGLVTPTSAEVGRHLIEGLRNPTTVSDDRAEKRFSHRPMSTAEAIHQAVRLENS